MTSHFCRSCGAPLAEDQPFCTKCGTPANAAPAGQTPSPETPAVCPNCGTPRNPMNRFCMQCGRPYDGATAAPAGKANPETTAPSGAQPTQSKRGTAIAIAAAAVVLVAAVVALALFVLGSGGGASEADDAGKTKTESVETKDEAKTESDTGDAEGTVGGFGMGSSSAAPSASDENAFIVGFDGDYPPFGYQADPGEDGYLADNGQTYTGFDLDLAAEVCNRNGWTLKVQPIDWDSKDAMLESGEITCVWNGFTYDNYQTQYTWSDPYMYNLQVVVVRADSGIYSLKDLAGKNVVTQDYSFAFDLLEYDDSYTSIAATFNGGGIGTVGSYTEAFDQLEQGTVDAVVCDSGTALQAMADHPDAFMQQDETLYVEHYAIAFAPGQEDMAQTVSDTLREMDADGFVEELCAKYEGDVAYSDWCLHY
ncbi:transporter substrate-binding domain-containing protein [Slackia heliotrinireducens]|uniref:transporter substrate-binding domain-containing protein n=1 Tax=Slackia heliotrinireducens TaxID=84110 RepID=UPI0033160A24